MADDKDLVTATPVSKDSKPNSAANPIFVDAGTDGASPPSITGTGIRGWLRAIYERLVVGVGVTGAVEVSNDAGNPLPVSAVSLPLPAGASTAENQQTNALTQAQLETELDEKLGDLGAAAGAASAPVVTATDDANLASLKVKGAGAEATAQRVTLATETLEALELIGIKGADGSTIASTSNTVPVGIPGLATSNIGQLNVTSTEAAIPTTVNSKTVSIKALAANTVPIYIGPTGVSTTNGYELSPGDSVEADVTDAVALFAVCASGTQRLCHWRVA